MLTALSAIVAIAKFLSMGLAWWQSYSANRAAIAQSQLEAVNADIKRTQDAADAGSTVTDSLRDITTDPNNRAGKPPAGL